jgi:hypothetical protein
MECYVGLDVHSKASVFVIQDGRGQVMTTGGNPTDAGGIPPLARGAAPPGRHPGGTGDRHRGVLRLSADADTELEQCNALIEQAEALAAAQQ